MFRRVIFLLLSHGKGFLIDQVQGRGVPLTPALTETYVAPQCLFINKTKNQAVFFSLSFSLSVARALSFSEVSLSLSLSHSLSLSLSLSRVRALPLINDESPFLALQLTVGMQPSSYVCLYQPPLLL